MSRPPTDVGTFGSINLKEQPNGTWLAETWFRMSNGTLKRVRRFRKTKKSAEAALKKRLALLAKETSGGAVNGDTRMGKIIDLWLVEIEREAEQGGMSRDTVRQYKSYAKNWVRKAIGELQAREAEQMAGSFNNLIQRVRKERSYEAARSVRAVLTSICAFAIREQAMTVNPVKSTSRLVQGKKKKVVALTMEQRVDLRAKLVKFGQGKQTDSKGRSVGRRGQVWLLLPDMMDAMLSTGVRIGELLALAGDDIDPANRRVLVRHHIVPVVGGVIREELRKGDQEGLDLKVPEWSVPTWRRLKLQSGGGPLFRSFGGSWLRPDAIVDRLKEAFKACDYDITSHVWRKTVADVLKQAGLPTHMIADQLGNTVKVVEDHYRTKWAANDVQATALEAMRHTLKPEDKTG